MIVLVAGVSLLMEPLCGCCAGLREAVWPLTRAGGGWSGVSKGWWPPLGRGGRRRRVGGGRFLWLAELVVVSRNGFVRRWSRR
jgi:hypothetical protein